MRLALVLLAACGGGAGARDAVMELPPPGEDPGGYDGLIVSGNRILHLGIPFHGRGADLHDERSCEACAFAPRNPDGVNRWSDELIDNWHASFIRFLLSAKAAPLNQFEQQWMN